MTSTAPWVPVSVDLLIGPSQEFCGVIRINLSASPPRRCRTFDLAIAETEYVIKELGLHAVIIYQNVNRHDLDSEFLWPFYECVEGLGIPLLVHGVDSGPLLGV